MFLPRLLLFILLWTTPFLSTAQWAITQWVNTRIDDQLLVQLPYKTSPELDKKDPGTKIFTTETENIVLVVGSVDLRYSPKYSSTNTVTVESLNKSFNRILRSQTKALKGFDMKLIAQSNTLFANAPARAVRFSFVDEVRNQPAYLDFIYLWRGDNIYLLACAYRLPETVDTVQDRNRFLKSVTFDEAIPAKEL
ncbi:hypothetical protein SAMN02745146_2468 [Hymenobacter daecheongensis DSM 21074]|uniref:DUF1795 domain-containing protein n=1 Tax=Hymenobacter daecheongensis DSM 21074 TaxID=1121955 RepID=A0A1M6H0B9_9BACT|nr:hypothetical protein [Hymenobacter daecheongensis]SHJ15615.1 hypothetical protein SAMN02745146_2468 [Hymenobacter daecheongensis DSM 21074]